jgi:hypothetical protein
MQKVTLCAEVAAFALLFSFTSQAGVVAGLPAATGTGNCIPFGCAGAYGISTFQEIYASAAFAGPMTIAEIDFFSTQLTGGIQDSGTYTLSFSYSSKLVEALDLTNPANNISFGSQMFFSGHLPNLSGSTLSFTGTPFQYNPALGNLLLTVGVSGAVDDASSLFLDANATQTQVSRAWFGTTSGGNDSVGFPGPLVTQFDTVPEPTNMLMFGGGLLALAAVRLRQFRAQ